MLSMLQFSALLTSAEHLVHIAAQAYICNTYFLHQPKPYQKYLHQSGTCVCVHTQFNTLHYGLLA